MDYQTSLQYLDSFLNLERIDWSKNRRLWNLDRMRFLLQAFDSPEKSFKSVIIAGTKGKGSTGFFLESILTEAGIQTGFYTSPHLMSPRERIRLQGKEITQKDWAVVFTRIKNKIKSEQVFKKQGHFTYFEIMTLAAALAFELKGIQVAIWEVGMGGRLDATNTMGAEIALLTSIGLDHTEVLGDTVRKIAAEKVAVVNRKAHVVVGKQIAEAKRVIEKQIRKQKAIVYDAQKIKGMRVGLKGIHQQENAGLAARAAEILNQSFEFSISPKAIRMGLSKKDWPGRFEIVSKSPTVILDGAHNPSSIKMLVKEYQNQFRGKSGAVVFGTAKDKDALGMLRELSRASSVLFLIQAWGSRASEVEYLASLAKPYFEKIFLFGRDIEGALEFASKVVQKNEAVLVTGSFYIIGEVKQRVYARNSLR